MQSVIIKPSGDNTSHLQCPICGIGEELLRYSEDVTTKYKIRGLHGHTLRIAGEGEAVARVGGWITCDDCGAMLEMPSWMETEMSET